MGEEVKDNTLIKIFGNVKLLRNIFKMAFAGNSEENRQIMKYASYFILLLQQHSY